MPRPSFKKYLVFLMLFNYAICYSVSAEEASGKSGMIVTSNPIASEIGIEILKSGGNAVDAAVAAALAIGVAEPYGSGIGGGGAMLIYLREPDSLTYINYYECAPKMLPGNFNPKKESGSARAVLVPGTVAGLHHALAKYGKRNWESLLNHVIRKLETGFIVDENLHQIILESYDKLSANPESRAIYLINDFPPETGSLIKNEKLIDTYKKLAREGPDIFYRGEIADSIEAAMRRLGGALRKSDLMKYHVRELRPLQGKYRDYEIFSAPPPQSGATVIETLNILGFKNLSEMGDYTKNPITFHVMAEALKRSYADRTKYLGDPGYIDVPVDILISRSFAQSRFQTINMQKIDPLNSGKIPAGDITPFLNPSGDSPKEKDGSTTHISVVDAAGNAVSLTQTLNYFWGTGISVCGFLLNNGRTSFSGDEEQINQIAEGRQPRTTISPSILFKNGKLAIVIGTPGAGRIIATLVEVICNIIDFGKGAEEANSAPRFYSRNTLEKIPIEDRFSADLLNQLQSMGYAVEKMGEMDNYFGGVQLILFDAENQIWIGSSDPRRPGAALGY